MNLFKSELDYEQSSFFLRDSNESERRVLVKIAPREKGDNVSLSSRVSPFSRGMIFTSARSTKSEEKWGLLVV